METWNRLHPRAARILVVDDLAEDRSLLVSYLRSLGHRLYAASNGQDGFELARSLLPDLIILDVNMPVCDGFACCRLLKASSATAIIPVIFLSAAGLARERVQGLSEGAVDYITKPFDLDEVKLRVAIHLPSHRLAPAAASPQLAQAFHGQSQATSEDSLLTAIFRAAQKRLLADLADVPDLAGLARAVGTNTKRLNEAFRQCAGATAFEYLRELRMREARKLLVTTKIDIQTIAAGLGYNNPANFATAFRERFGVSPREFRSSGALDESPMPPSQIEL